MITYYTLLDFYFHRVIHYQHSEQFFFFDKYSHEEYPWNENSLNENTHAPIRVI